LSKGLAALLGKRSNIMIPFWPHANWGKVSMVKMASENGCRIDHRRETKTEILAKETEKEIT